MAFYLPVQCPTFFEELRRRLRGWRGQVTVLGYASILVLILMLVTHFSDIGSDPHAWPLFGRTLWAIFYITQLVVVVLSSPSSTAGAICAERDAETLDLLLLTRISSFSLVMGKFFGAIGQMLLMIVSGLPVIAVVFFFGGVSPAEVLCGYALIIAAGIGYASLGFLASCLSKKVPAAISLSTLLMLLILAVIPAAIFAEASLSRLAGADVIAYFCTLQNPFITAVMTLQNSGHGPASQASVWYSISALLLQAVCVLALCLLLVRRMRRQRFLRPRRVTRGVPSS
jgi:ABC-type transport system involved in multi-copper enzyme maturation permease subunit